MNRTVTQLGTHEDRLMSIRDKIALFGALTDKQVCELVKQMDTKRVSSGQVMFEEGDLPSDIFIILSGEVELSLGGVSETSDRVNLKAGDCFGESALMGIQKQAHSANVVRGGELLVLSGEVLMQLFSSNQSLFALLIMNIAREVSRRFHGAIQQLKSVGSQLSLDLCANG